MVRTERITVRLSPEGLAVLAEIAARRDIPLGQVAREAFAEYVQKNRKKAGG